VVAVFRGFVQPRYIHVALSEGAIVGQYVLDIPVERNRMADSSSGRSCRVATVDTLSCETIIVLRAVIQAHVDTII
jgi:hypothetical protein